MMSTTILALVVIIAAVGTVASVPLILMAPHAHATGVCVPFCDSDDSHGKSFHDLHGDFHSHGKAWSNQK